MNDYEQKFVINVKIEPIDIIHLQKVTFKTKFKIPKFNCFFLILILFVFIALLLTGNNSDTSMVTNDMVKEDVELPWGLIIGAILIIILFLLMPIFIKKEALKQYKNNKQLHSEIKYILTDNELYGYSEYVNIHYPWDSFCNMIETNHAIILYLPNNTAILLPKRYFLNIDDIELVKKLIQEKILVKK